MEREREMEERREVEDDEGEERKEGVNAAVIEIRGGHGGYKSSGGALPRAINFGRSDPRGNKVAEWVGRRVFGPSTRRALFFSGLDPRRVTREPSTS